MGMELAYKVAFQGARSRIGLMARVHKLAEPLKQRGIYLKFKAETQL